MAISKLFSGFTEVAKWPGKILKLLPGMFMFSESKDRVHLFKYRNTNIHY